MTIFRKTKLTPEPLPLQKSDCEKAGGTGHGWEVTLSYHESYRDWPWLWTLWRDGKNLTAKWAYSRKDALEAARKEKECRIKSREGLNESRVVTL